MNQENLNNNVVPETVQPTYTNPTQPAQSAPAYTQAQPVQSTPTYTNPTQPAQSAPAYTQVQPAQSTPTYTQPVQSTPTYVQPDVVAPKNEVEEKVSNLNKEDAMEEALSHTNQYTPFEVQQEEVNQETNFMSNKKALIFLGIILGIMLLFIVFLPQISKLMGL